MRALTASGGTTTMRAILGSFSEFIFGVMEIPPWHLHALSYFVSCQKRHENGVLGPRGVWMGNNIWRAATSYLLIHSKAYRIIALELYHPFCQWALWARWEFVSRALNVFVRKYSHYFLFWTKLLTSLLFVPWRDVSYYLVSQRPRYLGIPQDNLFLDTRA